MEETKLQEMFDGFSKKIDDKLEEHTKTVNSLFTPPKQEDTDEFMGFKNFGEVINLAIKGDKSDSRFKSINETTDSDGGFLIPSGFSTQILKNAIETANLPSRCMRIPVSSNSISLPYLDDFTRSGGAIAGGSVSNYAEGATIAQTDFSFGELNLKVKKKGAIIKLTNEMIEDSPISITSYVQSLLRQTMAWQMDNDILNGNGTNTVKGIINDAALVTVSEETSQATTTLVKENIDKMYARQWNKNNAVWVMNHDVFPQLAKLYAGSTYTPMWINSGGMVGAPPATLYNRPIIFTEHAQTLGTAGDVYFLDLSQYIIAEKTGGVRQEMSMHFYFDTDAQALRITYRWDGQGGWKSAMTPYKGSTLSPFVICETRDGQ